MTRWSNDRGDNTRVFSRAAYSVFLWENVRKRKIISHPEICPIPLMTVNEEDDDTFSAYLNSTHITTTKEEDARKVDQHPTGQTLTLPVVMIVRYHHNNKMKLCKVIEKGDVDADADAEGIKAGDLNSKVSHILHIYTVAPVCEPEPSDILDHPQKLWQK